MPDTLRILVVDDNRSAANALARILSKQGDQVEALFDGASAIRRIQADPPDVVFTDLKMEPVDGMAVLQAARDQRPPVECMVFTAFGDIDIAVRAMRLGARDFLTKPVTVEQVSSRLDQLRGESDVPHPAESPPSVPLPFVADSPAGRRLLEGLRRAANVRSRVWIEGEIGSGRVFCAETLHAMSRDAAEPLTIRDLGRDDPWPERGTVVLPNVDDLPDDLQRRLYRQLKYVPDKVRVIATAAAGGRRMITEGTLRPELYYTLAVVVVSVPPLRDRVEDIAPLFQQALDVFAERYEREPIAPDAGMLEGLKRHTWHGNVRELLNLAERMVVMGSDPDQFTVVESTGGGLPDLEPGFSLSAWLEAMERRILTEALRKCGGDRAAAGRLLGVERNTLRYKLNKYGLLD